MLETLVIIFFGWPALLAAVAASLISLFRHDYRLLIVAAILAVAPCWYLSGFPKVGSPIFLAPAMIFGSAFALNRGHEMIAWLLAVPFYLLVGLLANIVVTQSAGATPVRI